MFSRMTRSKPCSACEFVARLEPCAAAFVVLGAAGSARALLPSISTIAAPAATAKATAKGSDFHFAGHSFSPSRRVRSSVDVPSWLVIAGSPFADNEVIETSTAPPLVLKRTRPCAVASGEQAECDFCFSVRDLAVAPPPRQAKHWSAHSSRPASFLLVSRTYASSSNPRP